MIFIIGFSSEKIIKELCKKKEYEKIGSIVESNFRINDILKKYRTLTEEEKILTIISYYIYCQDNPLEEKTWNYRMQETDLSSEMFRLAELEDGINYLYNEHNSYFINNIKEIINVDFLKNCTKRSIICLYNNGYKDFIIQNVLNYKISSKDIIKGLLSISEFRDKVITKEFLMYGFNSRYHEYFFDLPDDRKELLGCYGAFVFTSDNYSVDTKERLKNNLRDLFKNNFLEFSDDLSNRLVELYGNVSYYIICFTISKVIIDNNYLDKMQDIADKFFEGRIEVVLNFCYKYPNLSINLFKLKFLDRDNILKINTLANIDILDKVDKLTVEEFLNSDINDFSYSFSTNDYLNKYDNISPLNLKSEVVLYNYYREIDVIDNKGNWMEFLVRGIHDDTLREIYNSDKGGIGLLYDANINGDILFVIENAGLIIWLPPIMTKIQKNTLLDKLEVLRGRKGIDIYIGVANPNINSSYVYLNDGMSVNINRVIDSIERIIVKDDLKIKKKNNY